MQHPNIVASRPLLQGFLQSGVGAVGSRRRKHSTACSCGCCVYFPKPEGTGVSEDGAHGKYKVFR